MRGALLLAGLLGVSAPAAAQSMSVAQFSDKTADVVASLIAQGCIEQNWKIVVQTERRVECHYTDGTAEAEQTDALIGALSGRRGSYSTFVGVARFAIIPLDGFVRVQASDALVSTSRFGRTDEQRGVKISTIRRMMMKAGGQIQQ